jgi:hypothetical protein
VGIFVGKTGSNDAHSILINLAINLSAAQYITHLLRLTFRPMTESNAGFRANVNGDLLYDRLPELRTPVVLVG